ncbi:MAG TPA: tRNA 4-thiouridine(8) synthase ThiI [bacterium]|mgnify:CR=1 FL=1|nr:tRNA 4-thiouridine(8) synthase ThiI [bacterium]
MSASKKIFGLFSGGLDSILSCKLMCDLGFDVEALYFSTLFQKFKNFDDLPNNYFFDCVNGNFKIRTIDINDKFLEIVKKPKFGYGKNINPCIDCKILFLNEALEIMRRENGLFVFTGEVLGQRPKSQKKNTLLQISKNTSGAGYIVRPLSGKLLPPTIPEIKGIIKRDALLEISGRSREIQTELAKKLNLRNYGQPAGGCLLTDKRFSEKLKHLLENNLFTKKQIEYLKLGRNYAFDNKYKIIVGRIEKENDLIEFNADVNDLLFTVDEVPSPTTIILSDEKLDLKENEELILTAAKLTVKYSDKKNTDIYKVRVFNKTTEKLSEISINKNDLNFSEKLIFI